MTTAEIIVDDFYRLAFDILFYGCFEHFKDHRESERMHH
jgi:hypothetical protein